MADYRAALLRRREPGPGARVPLHDRHMRSLSPATELRPTGTPAVSQHGSMLATGFENSLLGMAVEVGPAGREAAMQLVRVWEAGGRFTVVGRAGFQFFGLPSDRLVGRSAFGLLHPGDGTAPRSALQHLLAHPGASLPLGRVRVPDRQHDWRLVEVVATNLLHHRSGGIRIGVRLLQWPAAGGTGRGTGPAPG